MKILVTGGAGFIASHIVDAYIAAGHEVAIIDNFQNGSVKNLNKKAEVHIADIRDYSKMESIMKDFKPDVLNHHAAVISVLDSVNHPEETFAINDTATYLLAQLFSKYAQGPRQFIFASTGGGIYGNAKELPATESTEPNPLTPYAESKLFAEHKLKFLSKRTGIKLMILRYANVYGPRQGSVGEAGVFSVFMKQMKNGITPVIFGDGTKSRDYVHVYDVVDANEKALFKTDRSYLLNISTDSQVTDKTVYSLLAEQLEVTAPPVYCPFRPGEVVHSRLSNSDAKAELDWSPTITIGDGVKTLFKAKKL